MKEKIREIAARLRELRELAEMSEQETATAVAIPVETYLAYERGETDIPASLLFRLAELFHVELGVLLTGQNPHMRYYTVTRKGHGVEVERREAYRYQNLAANFIHARMEPFLVTVPPPSSEAPPPQHTHPGQEFEFILDGRMMLYIHDQQIILEPGDSIYFDSNCPHAMRALDGKSARFLAVII